MINSNLMAASTIDIELVRDKTVLDDRDREIIDAFLAESIGDFLTTRDFTSIAKLRAIILNNQKSKQPNQNQYADQFSESAHKYISEGHRYFVSTWEPYNICFCLMSHALNFISRIIFPFYFTRNIFVLAISLIFCLYSSIITLKSSRVKCIFEANAILLIIPSPYFSIIYLA